MLEWPLNQVKATGFDRFAYAQKLNERVVGGGGKKGPFWGHPKNCSFVTKDRPEPFPFDSLRQTDTQTNGVQEVWKLCYAGSVGSQALLGIPRVADLRFNHFKDVSEVWPFETGLGVGNKRVVFAEIWPGIVNGPVAQKQRQSGRVKDADQVEAMVEWCIQQDNLGKLAGWMTPKVKDLGKVIAEEGWILGAGESPESTDVADLFAYAFAAARKSGMSEDEIASLVEKLNGGGE